ncbi:AbrB/MazE/SpoVT family DNA-binding domain-containing protein [Methylobacterium indicum]|uniref:AbrB/MazE/SpoVT family DNA-binding domain-containing protein n=1 Tax=Methylobacterium indicum TaxID=1775910 RepID=UPI000F0A2AD2|nr:AbrB/MazE/SpoVT family DNA-binding domain-containing protein [Methylobacterium indicum]
MLVQFAKWGNSIALRIPSHALRELGASEGMTADLTVEAGKLVVKPLQPQPRYSLDALLDGITEENIYEEYFSDAPRGAEIA